VLIAGCLELLLVAGDTALSDAIAKFRRPRWDADVKRFFIALGPAVIGSAGVQLALFADTIIASFLPAGALSALYYADRLAAEVLSLPMHAYLDEPTQDRIIDAVRRAISG